MCCSTTTRPIETPHFTGRLPGDCGCGCIGRQSSTIQLERYRDHLKAELTAVEKQIREMDHPSS